MNQRRALMSAGLLVIFGGGCAASRSRAPDPGVAGLASSSGMPLKAASPAEIHYLSRIKEQLVPRCSEQLRVLCKTIPAGANQRRMIEVSLILGSEGQISQPPQLRGSGDDDLARAIVVAAAGLRYLPPLPPEWIEQRVTLQFGMIASVDRQQCRVQHVRMASQRVPPSEALELALRQGHYLRAQEIVLQHGARAEVIAVLQRSVASRRHQGVASAELLSPPRRSPERSLLEQAQRLAAVSAISPD